MQLIAQNLVDALTLGSIYALLALGLAMVFSIMNLVNFAHGELVMVGGYALLFLTFLPSPLNVLGAVVGVVLAALVMERVAFRPVRGAPASTLLVTSFTLGFLLQNLAIMITGGLPHWFSLLPGLAESASVFGLRVSGLALATIATTLLSLAILSVFLSRTSIGIQMRAAAEGFRMARILGVRANLVIASAFATSGALAGLASMLLIAQMGVVNTTFGSASVLVAFVAIVVGGMGSLRGAVLGGFLIGLVTVLFQTYLPLELRYYRDAFVYAATIVVLLVRPEGLFAPPSAGSRRV